MEVLTGYLAISLGVFVAVLYPVLLGFIRGAFPGTAAPGLPPWVKKYGGLLLFSLVTALIILATYRTQNPQTVITFWAGLLMGFGWESSIEKLLIPPKRGGGS